MACFAILLLSVCFLSASLSFSEELMPEPGTVIDKSNYRKYAHLFPEEFLPVFEDGFGGLMDPATITVGESNVYHQPKAFLTLSKENKGRYSLDADGNLIGGWNRNGLPFPDLQRSDQDFLIKFMWNYAGRYNSDCALYNTISYMQRRGERARNNRVMITWLYFINRIEILPTPIMKNPNDSAYAVHFLYKEPTNVKNMQTLSHRYMDLQKPDETYIYVPSLRRVLRGDSGQRSVPLQGNLAALDDVNLFDGKTNDFTYKLITEQKILNAPLNSIESLVDPGKIVIPSDGWFPVDVYVIDIIPKNPVYPQNKKRIWIDTNTLRIIYAATWDRAGKLWKVWHVPSERVRVGDTWTLITTPAGFGVDLQFGMTNVLRNGAEVNMGGLTYVDVTPSTMLRKAR